MGTEREKNSRASFSSITKQFSLENKTYKSRLFGADEQNFRGPGRLEAIAYFFRKQSIGKKQSPLEQKESIKIRVCSSTNRIRKSLLNNGNNNKNSPKSTEK